MIYTPVRPLPPDDDTDDSPRSTRRRLILGAVAVVVLAVLATWLVAFSPVFGVKTVEVRGEHALTSAQIRSAADIANGSPLVRLDTDAIRSRVEQLPDIASATVTTSFPSTVTITVTERVAIGVVQAGGGYRLVDRTGAQYRTVTSRPAGLPLFAVPTGTEARASGRAVATVASALSARLRAKIDSIEATNPDTITLALHNGRTVQWGSAADSAAKARVLPALLHLTRKDSSAQINVADPGQPYTH